MDSRTSAHARSWREELLLTLTHWSAVFGGVIAIGVIIRARTNDFIDIHHPAFTAMLIGYFAIVALRLTPRLPFAARAVTLIGAGFTAAVCAVVLRGLAPAPVLLIGLDVLLAALFFGRVGMVAGLAITGATLAAIGRPEPSAGFSQWLTALDVVCVAGVLTVIVQFVVSRLENSVSEWSLALERVQSEQALRAQTRDELLRTQATLQQAQKLDAVGRLAGGVAHDFNNTLQVVLGWTELLRDETDMKQLREGIDHIHDAAERSRGLTRQLLTFSRPEMAMPTRIDLDEFLPSLVHSYRRLMPDDVSIVARTDPGLSIFMDKGHLNQVLLNLVMNARDAMPTGGTLALIARFSPCSELPPSVTGFEHGAIEIDVTDTGTGMDEETRSRVFEPFFTTKGTRGTGLGLSTVYGVVHKAHGAIDIRSAPGDGTSVRLFFPPAIAVTEMEMRPASGALASQSSVGQPVLLAEDDRDIRTTLARALRQAGHRVVEVSDVASGRVVVRERGAEFAILVTDGIMPGGSTRQLIDEYLRVRPDGRVVVCSGYIDDELSTRDLGAHAFEFVPKPFSPSELVSKLDSNGTGSRPIH
jgi:signal transduction histidine kinase/ActR/RegA family two-component response regulator